LNTDISISDDVLSEVGIQ